MSKVLVIGGALSGIAISKFLHKKGYEVILTDAKEIKNKEELSSLGIKVVDNGHPDYLMNLEYAFVVKNPGIKYNVPIIKYFVDNNIAIYNEIEVALWYCKNYHIAAITGTNGKTTTTTLLGELLKKKNPNNQVAGNIGVPLSEIALNHETEHLDIALEIAALQLVATKDFHPYVSCIVNLTPDHVDYFGDVDKYYQAKTLVYQNQDKNDYFLRNIDDMEVIKYCQNIPCQTIDFSLEKTNCDLYYQDNQIFYHHELLVSLKDFKLVGMHNIQNAMIACCMAYIMGVKKEDIQTVINEFKGVEHRIEFVREFKGVKYYNDSKGTNVDATIVALKAFKQPVHLLAGGYDKKTGFDDLKPWLGNVKQMYIYGDTADQLMKIYPNGIRCKTMAEALHLAKDKATSGEVVLLSPACASWDQFPNYEVRGKEFKQQVNSLK